MKSRLVLVTILGIGFAFALILAAQAFKSFDAKYQANQVEISTACAQTFGQSQVCR